MNWLIVCFIMITLHNDVSTQLKYRGISSRTITTSYGVIRGVILDSYSDSLPPVEAFLGVPYAEPPVGSLRFMHPVTLRDWSGVYVADSRRPICPQNFNDESDSFVGIVKSKYIVTKRLSSKLNRQSEDCLYLNIYTPTTAESDRSSKSKSLAAVMVFIQAESYESSSANSYEGTILTSLAEVIVITMSYRLGVLGFFTLQDHVARGNYGIMDQIAALHWIKQNIKEFGGDPDKLTVFGHGIGATFVNHLIASPLNKGLFKRAILQSGSGLNPQISPDEMKKNANEFISALNCERNSSLDVLKCLKEKDIEDIMSIEIQNKSHGLLFGPIGDGVIIPKDIKETLKSSRKSNCDVMCGVTKIENSFGLSTTDLSNGISWQRRDEIIRNFVIKALNSKGSILLNTIVNEYIDWTKPKENSMEYLQSTLETLSDALVVAPLLDICSIMSRGNGKSYFYVFSHQTNINNNSNFAGSIHGDELQYLFGEPLKNGARNWYTDHEQDLSQLIIRYWTNFAKSGNPNAFERTSKFSRKAQWPLFKDSHKKYLSLGVRPRIRQHYRAHKLGIWNNLIPELTKLSKLKPIDMNTVNTFETSFHVALQKEKQGIKFASTDNTPIQSKDTKDYQYSNEDEIFDEYNTEQPSNEEEEINESVWWYSTALSVIIAVGCTLFFLNALLYVSIHCKRVRKKEMKHEVIDVRARDNEHSSDIDIVDAVERLSTKFQLSEPEIVQDSIIEGRNLVQRKQRSTFHPHASDQMIH